MREIKFRAWDKIAKKFMWPWPDGFHLLGETTCFDLIGQQLGIIVAKLSATSTRIPNCWKSNNTLWEGNK